MNEKFVFADVDLPFHVWVREGSRWVLREALTQTQQGLPHGTGSPAGGPAGTTAGGGSR